MSLISSGTQLFNISNFFSGEAALVLCLVSRKSMNSFPYAFAVLGTLLFCLIIYLECKRHVGEVNKRLTNSQDLGKFHGRVTQHQ
nr:hypothetical protein CFP56_08810 [Quercus suber]